MFTQYLNEPKTIEEIQSNLNDARDLLEKKKNKPDQDPDKKTMFLKQINTTNEVLRDLGDEKLDDYKEHLTRCKDVLSQWLDDKLGRLVNDNSIFNTLPKKYEKLFHEDMNLLNVSIFRPDTKYSNSNGKYSKYTQFLWILFY